MRLYAIVLLLAAAPNAAPAQTTTPVSLGDVGAIAAVLGVDARQMHGLVTVKIRDGAGGGLFGLPPGKVAVHRICGLLFFDLEAYEDRVWEFVFP